VEPTAILASLNGLLTAFEKGSRIIREWSKKTPVDTPAKSEVAEVVRDMEQAEQAMQLAKVQLAQSLGYLLCQRHFPPGIMLKLREGVFRCEQCGDVIGESTQLRAETEFDPFAR
jgi:hypothetical protein